MVRLAYASATTLSYTCYVTSCEVLLGARLRSWVDTWVSKVPRLRDPGQYVGPPLDLGDFFFPLASGLEFSVGIFCRDSNLGIPFSDIFLQGFKPRRPIAQHFIWQDGRGRPAPRLRRGLRRELLHELRHGL